MVVKSIELLSDGSFQIDLGMLVYGKERYYGQKYDAALKPALIDTDDGYLLVDTGIGELPEPYDRYIEHRHEPTLIDELRSRDLHPDDIAVVINTHLHFDHCGNNRHFENAEFYVQRDELDYALDPHRFQAGGYIQQLFEGRPYNTRQGPYRVREGVDVIPTYGHTPGHQSVLVAVGEDEAAVKWDEPAGETEERYIYCGDVAPLEENLERRNIVGVLYDPVDALGSIDLLRQFDGTYIYSHDNDQLSI